MVAGLGLALLGDMPSPSAHSRVSEDGSRPARAAVWRIPAVLFAIALISVTFFGDGALESFLSTYLQRTLAGGVLLSGFGPATLSLAGRSAPGRSRQAVATTTAAGYGAFIVSPLGIGLLAQATSLRVALGLLIVTSLGIAGLATRWPESGG
jgi:hypothetical protein